MFNIVKLFTAPDNLIPRRRDDELDHWSFWIIGPSYKRDLVVS